MAVSFNGRVEALINVPSGVSVSASNSGGGATSVSLTEDSYFWTAAGSVDGLAAHIKSQLDSTRAPSSGAWSVSVSASTGLCSIGCTGSTTIPSFSIVWTSTALRDILGFERDIDYAQTAQQMASDVGGTWTAGYLFNESSGNAASVFGTPATLTATNSPTYSNQGPRGGADKAIGFANTSYFDGGNVFDVGATDDLLVAWVGYLTDDATTFSTLISKVAASFGNGWAISTSDGHNYKITAGASGAVSSGVIDATSIYDEWHVGMAVIDRSTGKMRIGMQGLTSGTSLVGTEGTIAVSASTTANLRVGASAWTSQAATTWTCAALYIGTGSGVATGLSAGLAAALASFAATLGTRTGTKQCRGLFLPDCVLNFSESYAKAAPTKSDLRSSQSPDGTLLSLVGNRWHEHASAMWKYVPKERVWENEADPANSSWEFFFEGTQYGLDSTGFFDPSSPLQIYDHSGNVVGINANSGAGVDGWQIRGLSDIAPKVAAGFENTDLRWTIELPALVAKRP